MSVMSEEFKVSKGVRQGWSLAPTVFKIYVEEALKTWKRKCCNMDVQIDNNSLYTLFFAGDQVLIAEDDEDMLLHA